MANENEGHEPDRTVQMLPHRSGDTTEQPKVNRDLPRDRGQLVVLIGDSPGRVYPLDSDEVVIGRGPEVAIQLQGTDISRRHALVRRSAAGAFTLVDLKSRNGTLVNGAPITEHLLQTGDKVRVGGKTVLMFTQYDRVEDMMLQAQKLEAIGRLAGGVAHDFNNLLTVLMANLSFLRSQPADLPVGESELQEAMADMDRATRRAADLTRQLLGLSRPGSSQYKPINVTNLLEEVVQLLLRTFGPDIEVVQDFRAGLTVRGDMSQLQQVMMNICINARDAMPNGGKLTITSSRFHVSEDDLSSSPLLPVGDYVRITVEDTGVGMSTEIRGRIFEPFFTTKIATKGTGMGLPIAYGIIKKHGGQIEVDSTPGRGSIFHVYVPAAESALDQTAPASEWESTRRQISPGIVLIVEDELTLQKSARRLLEYFGFGVVCASDGQEAINLFREHQDVLKVVLLDMVVPKISGALVFEAIHAMRPEIPILLTSGNVPETELEQVLRAGAKGYIAKPWNARDLLEALRRAVQPADED
jgi:two-component system, cell cycle sensor histidine kinase and response regulator CckA